jgi:hypothetical protein
MPLFTRIADFLNSVGGLINVADAPAPSVGQVLTASSATAAFWNLPAGGVNPFIASAQATSTITIALSGDALMPGMTLTPGAGNFMAWFSVQTQNSNAAGVNTFTIYVNGVAVAVSSRSVRLPGGASNVEASIVVYLSGVLAGQAIEVRWNATGGTATATNRCFNVMRTA